MRIWAHRGCSLRYPENTILSFKKSLELSGLTGIELDIQLTKDGKMVVCHDEKVNRTTNGHGYIKDYTLEQLKKLNIESVSGSYERIPTIDEVLDLLQPSMNNGLMLNIELKNSVIPYSGMEEKIITLIDSRGLTDSIIYSSFNAQSVGKIKAIAPYAKTGMLSTKISDCISKSNNISHADALHPYGLEIDVSKEVFQNLPVRAWFKGALYPNSDEALLYIPSLEEKGITDIFVNNPEKYL